jgi:pimeloyl-ACP methyl ester carboxylesterase
MQRQDREPVPDSPRPTLTRSRSRAQTRAVVLVLHGGKSVSREVSMVRNLAVLRMVPLAWRVRRRLRGQGVAVWRLRYRYRGWNGHEASPVHDARWALERVREEHGDVPVVLLGHSMGGRVAAHVLDDPSVAAAVALAPWLSTADSVEPAYGKVVHLVHGDLDRITSAAASRAWAQRASEVARRVSFTVLVGGEHFMLRRWRTWHRLAADRVAEAVAQAVSGNADDKTTVDALEQRA